MKRIALGFLGSLFFFSPPQHAPETLTITTQDCVDAVTDFNILHHQPTIFTPPGTFGVTDYYGRTIHLFDNFSIDLRRRTSIHELIHIKLANLGETQWSEETINAVELRLYKEIFHTNLR